MELLAKLLNLPLLDHLIAARVGEQPESDGAVLQALEQGLVPTDERRKHQCLLNDLLLLVASTVVGEFRGLVVAGQCIAKSARQHVPASAQPGKMEPGPSLRVVFLAKASKCVQIFMGACLVSLPDVS